jgi:putative acetyltransferase
VRIREVTPSDRSAIDGVVAAAFDETADGSVTTLVQALDESGAARAGLIAVDDEAVVGHVQLNRSWIDARERLVDVLVLSPLSVAPARQREGIGTALIRAALAEAEAMDAPAVFLEGDWAYYRARGFRAATPLGFSRPSTRIPEPAFQVALLSSYEPWMTGALIYCEAFWATDCVGLRDPVLAAVERRAPDLRRPTPRIG